MNPKKNLSRDLFVMDFVQFVSAPQTHAKRVRKIKKTMELVPSNLSETQWMKMWRGFYYAIWYSEMRKGGEELIVEMGGYQNAFYLLSGFKSLTESWGGIDAFRIDKYMFLIRHMLRNVMKQQISALLEDKVLFEGNLFLEELKKGASSKTATKSDGKGETVAKPESLTMKANVISYIASVTSNSIGFFLHVCDMYLDELENAITELEIETAVKNNIYFHMTIPFAKRLSTIQDDRLRRTIRANIFDKLFDEILFQQPIPQRIEGLSKFTEPLVEMASHTESGKNRNCLYSMADKVKSQVAALQCPIKDQVRLKRKPIGIDRKTKKVKYEVGTRVPFARSLVPLPLM